MDKEEFKHMIEKQLDDILIDMKETLKQRHEILHQIQFEMQPKEESLVEYLSKLHFQYTNLTPICLAFGVMFPAETDRIIKELIEIFRVIKMITPKQLKNLPKNLR